MGFGSDLIHPNVELSFLKAMKGLICGARVGNRKWKMNKLFLPTGKTSKEKRVG